MIEYGHEGLCPTHHTPIIDGTCQDCDAVSLGRDAYATPLTDEELAYAEKTAAYYDDPPILRLIDEVRRSRARLAALEALEAAVKRIEASKRTKYTPTSRLACLIWFDGTCDDLSGESLASALIDLAAQLKESEAEHE